MTYFINEIGHSCSVCLTGTIIRIWINYRLGILSIAFCKLLPALFHIILRPQLNNVIPIFFYAHFTCNCFNSINFIRTFIFGPYGCPWAVNCSKRIDLYIGVWLKVSQSSLFYLIIIFFRCRVLTSFISVFAIVITTAGIGIFLYYLSVIGSNFCPSISS